MKQISVVICALLSSTLAIWITDVISPRGLDIGSGLTIKLDDSKRKNSTILERVALKMNYGDYGVSVAKSKKRNALDLDFYANEKFEGRGKKDKKGDGGMMPFLVGFKSAGIMSLILGSMKVLVIKALIIAKFALVTSAIILFAKLIHSQDESPQYVEIEHHGSEHYPVYTEFGHSTSGVGGGGGGSGPYHPSSAASGNYYAYSNYAPSAAADTALNYATVESSAGNSTVTGNQQVAGSSIAKRRDYTRRRHKLPTILTVRRYSVET